MNKALLRTIKTIHIASVAVAAGGVFMRAVGDALPKR
jgi:hypothetical protein